MDGVLIIDKPPGMTSYDVIRNVKRLLGMKKVGHAGTLDPLATGVLIICVNEATKITRFFSNDDKDYRATMLLGVRTDTLDTDGTVTDRCKPCLQEREIRDAVDSFVGRIEQRAPKYSAVKFNGRPLYKWARRGIDIEPPLRKVDIYNIQVEDIKFPYVTFSVSCSKGTYIRSLCDDMGNRLGCGACLSGLRRTRSGRFTEEDAVSLEDFTGGENAGGLEKKLIPLVDALSGICDIEVDQDTADRIRKGYQPDYGMLREKDICLPERGTLVKFVTRDRVLIAVAETCFSPEDVLFSDDGERAVKILRVFN